jgi:hypothetical protein
MTVLALDRSDIEIGNLELLSLILLLSLNGERHSLSISQHRTNRVLGRIFGLKDGEI